MCVRYVDRFLAVQREAQQAGVGLWGSGPSSLPTIESITEQPAPTPIPAEPLPAVAGSLVIIAVNYRDEYVDIQNLRDGQIDLVGWNLLSLKGEQNCPLNGVIRPGETLRVYALSEDAGQGGFNCGFGKNIWNNSERDPAVLYDPSGIEVSRLD